MPAPTTDRSAGGRRVSTRARVGIVGLVVVMVAALGITLNPTPVDRDRGDTVRAFLDVLHAWGVPESFGYLQLEFTANIVMFLPIGLCLGLIVGRKRWWVAFALPVVLSVGVELAQFLFLPERFADPADVLANSLGGWIGACIAVLIPGGRRATERQRD